MAAKSTRLNFEAARVFRFFFDLPAMTCKKPSGCSAFRHPDSDLSAVDPKCSATRPAPAKADRVGVKDQVSPPAKISFLITA